MVILRHLCAGHDGGLSASALSSALPQPAVLSDGALHPKIAWLGLPDMPIFDKTVKHLADLRQRKACPYQLLWPQCDCGALLGLPLRQHQQDMPLPPVGDRRIVHDFPKNIRFTSRCAHAGSPGGVFPWHPSRSLWITVFAALRYSLAGMSVRLHGRCLARFLEAVRRTLSEPLYGGGGRGTLPHLLSGSMLPRARFCLQRLKRPLFHYPA